MKSKNTPFNKLLQGHFPVVLLLILSIFFAFSSVLKFNFVTFDDYGHLHNNPSVVNFNLESLKKIWTEPYFGLYAPVTYTFWGFDFFVSKLFSNTIETLSPSPFIFHASNLLFHILNSLLLYWLILQLKFKKLPALIGALIFALHPVQVESVAWVSSFRDLLATFWGLLYLNLTLKYSQNGSKISSEVLLTLLIVLAILSKPSAVVFLILPLVLLYFINQRLHKTSLYAMFIKFTLVICFVIVTKRLQPDTSVDFIPSLWERLLLSLHSLSFYVQTIFWPASLTPDYGLSSKYLVDYWNSNGFPIFEFLAVLYFLGIIGWQAWHRRAWAVGLSLAIVAASPYLGLIVFNFQNVSTVADRYLYMPMLGIGLFFSVLIFQIKELQYGRFRIYAASLVAVVLGVLTFKQCQIWQSDESLFTRMTSLNSRSFYGFNGLGRVFFYKGQAKEAESMFQKSLDIRPSNHLARFNLASALQAQGKYQAAIDNYVKVLNKEPKYLDAYQNIAIILVEQGRINEAKDTLTQGLRIDPNSTVLNEMLVKINKL